MRAPLSATDIGGQRMQFVTKCRAKAGDKAASKAPLDPLVDLAKRRLAHKRAGDELDRETRTLIASRQYGATEIALALGISRQRVYQLAP